MTDIKKILVVGAGVAGPAVCYWLRKYGFSPTLIEKSPHLRKGGQGLDVRGVAIDLVRKMGIYEQICARRTRVERGCHVDASGSVLQEEQGETFGFRQGDDVEIVRGDLIEILMSTIEDVPFYLNRVVVGIQHNETSVEVLFRDGKIEHYDLVIGADGVHSAIRGMVFDESEYELINLGPYIGIFSIPNYMNLKHTEVTYEANQKMVSVTSDEDPKSAQVAFMFRSPHVLINTRDENEQKQFLRNAFHGFGWEIPKVIELMQSSDDFYFDSVMQVKMKSWAKGRVALLGDAAYCASPLSGQGNNLALVGAYVLAGVLKTAAGDYSRALTRYDELLRPFVVANQKLGAWVSESFLVADQVSKELVEERMGDILQKVQAVANAIKLPGYE